MSFKKQLEDVQFNLNKSYEKLDYHKETLNQQAQHVKEQIINNITMQIDAFNQRKNWLVNQLDLVKSEKMEAIQRQQDAVKCSIVKVKKFIMDNNKYTNIQIKDELENIASILEEETRPFLGFRSDSVLLREIISQYGVILKQYSGHFADPTRPSISLPRVVEEEDDEDNMSFTRKYELQNIVDQNVLYITKHPTNSSIVRAWLMTTSENGVNNHETESEITKSDQESFIKVDSFDSVDIKKIKEESLLVNENKELWLPKYEKQSKKESNKSINSKNQNNNHYFIESSLEDEEKEVDHCDLVKKVCKTGSCKTFYGCTEIENCCHNLINPNKPSWNKWLIKNHIFDPLLIKNSTCRNQFASKFSKVLNSENEKWLDKNDYMRHSDFIEEKIITDSQICLTNNKISKLDCGSSCSIFNLPLEKWICLGRQQSWIKDKDKFADIVDTSLEKVTLDEMDGLLNGIGCKNDTLEIDCNKWLISR